jgi:hypothetical protein
MRDSGRIVNGTQAIDKQVQEATLKRRCHDRRSNMSNASILEVLPDVQQANLEHQTPSYRHRRSIPLITSAACRRALRPTGSISASSSRSKVAGFARRPALSRSGQMVAWRPAELTGLRPLHTGGGVDSVGVMTEPTSMVRARDSQGEQVRKLRLRADGRRPLAVNLRDTILLTRKLFELRDAARRAR